MTATLGGKGLTLLANSGLAISGGNSLAGVSIGNELTVVSSVNKKTSAYVAAVTAAGGTVSPARQILINNLYNSLDAAGITSVLDRLWIFYADNTQEAYLDFIALQTATPTGAVTFTATGGIHGDGVSSFVNMNIGPSTGTNYTLNTASIFQWVGVLSTEAVSGAYDGTHEATLFSPFSDGNFYPRINDENGEVFNGPFTTGLFIGDRIDSGHTTAAVNGVDVGTFATAAAAPLIPFNFFVGAENNQGSGQLFDASTRYAFGSGGTLGATKRLALFNALLAYIGVPTSPDIDVQAWISAVGPSNTNQNEVNILTAMVQGIKSDLGITLLSQKFDRLWIQALGTQAAALVDLAARSSMTNHSATFTTLVGFTGNGSSTYLDSGFNQAAGTNYTQNAAAFHLWLQARANELSVANFGKSGTPGNTTFGRSSNAAALALNSNASASSTAGTVGATANGFVYAERSTSTTVSWAENGGAFVSFAETSAAPTSVNWYVNAANNGSNVAGSFSNGTVALLAASANLGQANSAAVYGRYHTALQALNAAAFP